MYCVYVGIEKANLATWEWYYPDGSITGARFVKRILDSSMSEEDSIASTGEYDEERETEN
jgi:hypothetical protein